MLGEGRLETQKAPGHGDQGLRVHAQVLLTLRGRILWPPGEGGIAKPEEQPVAHAVHDLPKLTEARNARKSAACSFDEGKRTRGGMFEG